MSATANRIEHIQEMLDLHYRNLQILEQQMAQYGGKDFASLILVNQYETIQTAVEQLEAELEQLKQLPLAPHLPPEGALPPRVLQARLEGILGPGEAERLTPDLFRNPAAAGPGVIIGGDGNVIGANNTVIIIQDAGLREQLRQVASAVIPPPAPLPPVRLFISATPDLEVERQAVKKALNQPDPAGVPIEAIGSQAVSPVEVRRLIEQECDLFLGLYGESYGEVIPGDSRSVSEAEYQAARLLNKPMLLYLQSGDQPDPAQAEFLASIKDSSTGSAWRELKATAQVLDDVRTEIERWPEWRQRPPIHERVLLASLGLSPGAVIGLYHALAASGKPAGRVVTFCPARREIQQAVGLCREEFAGLSVPYANHLIDAENIASDGDAREFKAVFTVLLKEALAAGAEVMVGITGGRTIMGALMAMIVQMEAPEQVSLYHLDVDDDIAQDGQLPGLWNFREKPQRWRELLSPPPHKRRLVRVPFVRFAKFSS